MIERAPRRRSFTIVDNMAVNDDRLSFRALGLLTYILSKPDHWRTNRDQLASTHTEGVAAVRAALAELEDHGYIVRHRERGDDGKFRWKTVVHESPGQTSGRFTADGLPAGGESAVLVSTEGTKTEKQPATQGTADADASLPGLADPQPVGEPVDDADALSWRIAREVYDARSPHPIEGVKRGRTVALAWLRDGVPEAVVRRVLADAPAWSPGSLQVELKRRRDENQRNRPANRVQDDWWTGDEANSGVWTPNGGLQRG